MRTTLLALLALSLFAACTSLDFAPRRKAAVAEAEWLASAFAAKKTTADPALTTTYDAAARQLLALARLLRSDAAAEHDSARADEEAECAIRSIRAEVADAEQRWRRHGRLLAQLRERHQQLKTKAEELAATLGAEADAAKGKALRAERETLLERRKDVAAWVLKLAADPAPFDEGSLQTAAAVLDGSTLEPADAERDRHTALTVKVAGLTERVKARLEAERQKKSDSQIVKRLEKATALLADAARRSTHDGKPVLAPAILGQVEGLVAEAMGELEAVDADIVLLSSPWFRTHAGAITISPYVMRKIDGVAAGGGSRYELTRTEKATSAYLELDFLHRRAWLDPEDVVAVNPEVGPFWLPDLAPDDYEVRMRMTSDNREIESAETAAGGDWSVEASTGWNLLGFGLKSAADCERKPALKKKPQGTVNLEVSGGLVTDRDAIDAHSWAQAGIGTAWSFPVQLTDNVWRTATLYSSLGYGGQEFPALDVDDRQYLAGERAEFHTFGALGVRVDFTIPLGQNFEFVTGGRLWDVLHERGTPENWSLWIGISVPLGKMFKAAFQ